MTYIDNQDLLKELRAADQALREEQADVRADTDTPLTRHIADHMRKWEELLSNTLDKLEKEMSDSTAKTFNQVTPHGSPLERLKNNIPAPRAPKELVQWTLKRHDELAEWCQTIGEQAISERTADLFNMLANQLKDINRQLASDTRSLEQE